MILSPSNIGWPCCSNIVLTACYQFVTSPTLGDDSAGSNDLSSNGFPAWAASGKANGGMLELDGSSEVYNDSMLDSSDLSMSMWFQNETYRSAGELIEPIKISDNSSPSTFFEVVFEATGTAAEYEVKLSDGGTLSSALMSGQTFDLTNLAFVALVVDQDTSIKLFVNDQSETIAGATGHTGAETLSINPGQSDSFVDEVYVSKGQLWTDADVSYLYNDGDGRFADSNGNFF